MGNCSVSSLYKTIQPNAYVLHTCFTECHCATSRRVAFPRLSRNLTFSSKDLNDRTRSVCIVITVEITLIKIAILKIISSYDDDGDDADDGFSYSRIVSCGD